MPTSRKIRVEIDGVVIAEADSGVQSLWETRYRPRWYLPKTAVVGFLAPFLSWLVIVVVADTIIIVFHRSIENG